jgi:YHS domain-containing protein
MKSPNSTIRVIVCFSFVLFLLSGFGCKVAGEAAADTVAIKGYDTVAYFKDGKALKGNESYSFRWHAMTWYFLSEENRDLFAANPEKYAPQYDGNCAWAMTESRKAITNPEVWRIVDGKLYLNCSVSAYEKWIKDIPGNIRKADKNWSKLTGGNLKEKGK